MLNNPYESITNWAEGIFPTVGNKVFSILSLQPCTLILPPIPYKDTSIRSNIHMMLFMNSGGAKTSIAKLYSKIAFNPFSFKSYTKAGLRNDMDLKGDTTIIVDDMATVMEDQKLLKLLEGMLEEQEVKDSSASFHYNYKTNCVGLFMSVPSDITSNISSGFLFRVMPLVLMHDIEEQKSVGEHIISGINTKTVSSTNLNSIRDHYQELLRVKIKGYDFKKDTLKLIETVWKDTLEYIRADETTYYYRELYDGIRLMNAHALLNSNHKDNTLTPSIEDAKLGASLMRTEMITKQKITYIEGLQHKMQEIRRLSPEAEKRIIKYQNQILNTL